MTDTPENSSQSDELSELGPYSIESRLGQGGMGIVYLATDKNLGRQVAIKVLHPHLLRHENLKQRFRREARMHAKLMHPNIVTLLSLYEDESHMALVMEKVNGHDLKQHLRKNLNLSIKDKLRISMEVLTGLDAAHQFGMVHRDLKPANVLVSDQGDVKLLDFGLAKPEEGEDDLTQSGATVGSFRYMAPEQILNKPIDARTDLYAFGILLFFMLTGKLPFDASSNGGEFEIMEKQVREPAPVPHELNPKIPLPISNLIIKLLSKNKHSRPSNALEVKNEIAETINQLETVTSPEISKPAPTEIIPELTTMSNADVAKEWVSHGQQSILQTWDFTQSLINRYLKGLSGIALLFVVLGSVAIAILNIAEDNAKQTNNTQVATQKTTIGESTAKKVKAAAETKAKETAKPAAAPAVVKETATKTPETKPVKPKPIKKVTKVKPKPKKPVSLTYKHQHSVIRNDDTSAKSNEAHEFRGGQYIFFPQLAQKSWGKAFKKGASVLKFKSPVSISTIILHKASVGRLDFNHGYVRLDIQKANSSSWKTIFERDDDDVDIAVTLKGIKKKYPKIQAVRLLFKTPEPITVGPIDLLP